MLQTIIVSFAKFLIRLSYKTVTRDNYQSVRDRFNFWVPKLHLPRKRKQFMIDTLPVEWVNLREQLDGRVILYFHGGAYLLGNRKTSRDMIHRIARKSGARALSVEYRLAPENPHPAALVDALCAYQWLLDENIDPAKIAVLGDSSGGGLSMALLQNLRNHGKPLPACGIFLSPWFDVSLESESLEYNCQTDPIIKKDALVEFARMYAGNMDTKTPAISPLYGDISNLPPMLIQATDTEALLDDSKRMAAKAKKIKAPIELEIWPGLFHGWQIHMLIPGTGKAVKKIGEFIKEHIPLSQ